MDSYIVQRLFSKGAIILGDKAQITQANILGKNGILHKINKPLIPVAVLPLVNNFANITTYSSVKVRY